MNLFIDTTLGITVGLLNEENEWVEYKSIKGQKGSAIIHKLIFDMINKYSLKIQDLVECFKFQGLVLILE